MQLIVLKNLSDRMPIEKEILKDLRTYNKEVQTAKHGLKKIIHSAGRILFFWKRRGLIYSNLKNVKRILFISLYFRGDVLFQTPVIRILKNLFPEAKIDVWVKSRSAEVLKNNFNVNETLIFDSVRTAEYSEGTRKFDLKGKIGFLKKVRNANYDLVLDYTGLLSTSMYTFLSGARYTFGRNEQGFGFLYNNEITSNISYGKGHLISKYIIYLKNLLNIDDKSWQAASEGVKIKPDLFFDQKIEDTVKSDLFARGYSSDRKLVCIHLTAGWEAKRWKLEKYGELILRLINEFEYDVAVIGNEYDKSEFNKIMQKISDAIPQGKSDNMFFLKSLHYNAELIRQSDLFIGGDSAPLHISGAVDTKSIALFGPTNPLFSNPVGDNHFVIYNKLVCSAGDDDQYCTRNAGKSCPTIDCLKMITVDQVIDLITKIMTIPAKTD
jgi:ADP-heptose:LPS heptosyltransferase